MAVRLRRQEFLHEFLGALGAEEIIYSTILTSRVEGTVVYDLSDPEERQDFCWQMTEDDVPSRLVTKLARLLNDQSILDIDKITLSRSELRQRYISHYGESVDENEFVEILTELCCVAVRMVDDGELTDTFFIHE